MAEESQQQTTTTATTTNSPKESPSKLFTLDIGSPLTICDSLELLHGPRPLTFTEEALLFESTTIRTAEARTGFLQLKTKNGRIINIQAYYPAISPDSRLRGTISISSLQRMNFFMTGTRSAGAIIDENNETLFETTNSRLKTLTLVLNDEDIIMPNEESEYFSF
ncbi:hypothetical protein WICPIJ_005552 [Wickerhamomyces pijperi]|uniref:Uncharacterized protein n=1 Tax=Wickerhamomyces pijperi TaxID=599730 RepID=A0A9P8Q3Q5_WICPI|nr:hypothetical protein WICPIJ_005552 [Wickerhamomyces pijperi]